MTIVYFLAHLPQQQLQNSSCLVSCSVFLCLLCSSHPWISLPTFVSFLLFFPLISEDILGSRPSFLVFLINTSYLTVDFINYAFSSGLQASTLPPVALSQSINRTVSFPSGSTTLDPIPPHPLPPLSFPFFLTETPKWYLFFYFLPTSYPLQLGSTPYNKLLTCPITNGCISFMWY